MQTVNLALREKIGNYSVEDLKTGVGGIITSGLYLPEVAVRQALTASLLHSKETRWGEILLNTAKAPVVARGWKILPGSKTHIVADIGEQIVLWIIKTSPKSFNGGSERTAVAKLLRAAQVCRETYNKPVTAYILFMKGEKTSDLKKNGIWYCYGQTAWEAVTDDSEFYKAYSKTQRDLESNLETDLLQPTELKIREIVKELISKGFILPDGKLDTLKLASHESANRIPGDPALEPFKKAQSIQVGTPFSCALDWTSSLPTPTYVGPTDEPGKVQTRTSTEKIGFLRWKIFDPIWV
jgi:hypothetical protein